jgi:regulator of protease activity HflC (stomatin/prohibitin superfamily)
MAHQIQVMSRQVDVPAPSAPMMPVDDVNNHLVRPNAHTLEELVAIINGAGNAQGSCCTGGNIACFLLGACGLCTMCCGRTIRSGIGEVEIWLDSDRRPQAMLPNSWQLRPNLLHERVGKYLMTDDKPFMSQGVCIVKIEVGSVYFAQQGGRPVVIMADANQAGWYVSIEPGFAFATQVSIDNKAYLGCSASLKKAYINYGSIHIYNVKPTTVCVAIEATPGRGNSWKVLQPGTHSFNSPYMNLAAVIPTSVQDRSIKEDRITTQDGIELTSVEAVLSYQISTNHIDQLLTLDVANYDAIIVDWSKRVLLHSIGLCDYQAHRAPDDEEDESDVANSSMETGTIARKKPKASSSESSSVIGHRNDQDNKEGSSFRPALEQHMRKSLEEQLSVFGVKVVTFALQAFDPPAALATQLTQALAKRTEALYAQQAAKVNNQTLLMQVETENRAVVSRADAEARATRTKAEALKYAADMTAAIPHARRLQTLDREADIARAWASGNLRVLVQSKQGGTDNDADAVLAANLEHLADAPGADQQRLR